MKSDGKISGFYKKGVSKLCTGRFPFLAIAAFFCTFGFQTAAEINAESPADLILEQRACLLNNSNTRKDELIQASEQLTEKAIVDANSIADFDKLITLSNYDDERLTDALENFAEVYHDRPWEIQSSLTPAPKIDRFVREANLETINIGQAPISQVSAPYARELFAYLATQPHIPFGHSDICYARAWEMCNLLKNKGVQCGKAFVVPAGETHFYPKLEFVDKAPEKKVAWKYHTAPVLEVSEDGKISLWALDPSVANEPLPVEQWSQLIADLGGQPGRLYFTSETAISPEDPGLDRVIIPQALTKLLRKKLREAHHVSRHGKWQGGRLPRCANQPIYLPTVSN